MNDVKKIDCKERNDLFQTGGWSVGKTISDNQGTFGDPLFYTEWERGNERLSDSRYPDPQGGADTDPCEHYSWIETSED